MPREKKTKNQKRSYHHGDLHRALMDEGLKVLSREGFARLNLRELARQVGVSHGAPYRHFASREELILQLALEGATIFLQYLTAGRDKGGDTASRFNEMGLAYFRFATENPDHYRLIFNREVPLELTGEKVTQLRETMQASFMALVGMVQEMQQAGQIRKGDPFVLSAAIWSNLHGIVSLWIDGRFRGLPNCDATLSPEQAAAFFKTLTSYLMTGIGPNR